MDKRIYIIAGLAILAVVLTAIRESGSQSTESFSFLPTSKEEISGPRVLQMADSILHVHGIKKEKIRQIKNKNDVRVMVPVTYDPIVFIKAMRDSLEEYNANVVSIDNAKEKTTVVQIKNEELIVKSFIFSKEPAKVTKKGDSPSVPKKQIP